MITVEKLWAEHSAWSQETFGSDNSRGPIGPLKHLKKECDEAIYATNAPMHSFGDEMADCFLLLLDAARRGGLSFEMLVEKAAAKLEINKTRQWGKSVPGEPVFHVAASKDVKFRDTISGTNCAEWRCEKCGTVWVSPNQPTCNCAARAASPSPGAHGGTEGAGKP